MILRERGTQKHILGLVNQLRWNFLAKIVKALQQLISFTKNFIEA